MDELGLFTQALGLSKPWQVIDLKFSKYETYLHARVPRVRCGTCGVNQVEVPWARPGSGFTLLFELLVLSLAREMSVAAVAEMTAVQANRLWRILNHYVERARKAVDLSEFRKLGIDEFSLCKGHVYMTSFSDLGTSRVIFLGKGAKKEWSGRLSKTSSRGELPPARSRLSAATCWIPTSTGSGSC